MIFFLTPLPISTHSVQILISWDFYQFTLTILYFTKKNVSQTTHQLLQKVVSSHVLRQFYLKGKSSLISDHFRPLFSVIRDISVTRTIFFSFSRIDSFSKLKLHESEQNQNLLIQTAIIRKISFFDHSIFFIFQLFVYNFSTQAHKTHFGLSKWGQICIFWPCELANFDFQSPLRSQSFEKLLSLKPRNCQFLGNFSILEIP